MAAQISLGSLGTKRVAVDMEFDYFGKTIRVHPDASDLRVMDFMMKVGELDMENPAHANEIMKALSEQLLMQIHPDDASLFWETAKANHQQMADIMAVSKTIIEAVAAFPTGQPSASAGGPPTTQLDSALNSFGYEGASAAPVGPTAATKDLAARAKQTKDTEAALTLLRDRPDLQLAVLRAEQARRAEDSAPAENEAHAYPGLAG